MKKLSPSRREFLRTLGLSAAATSALPFLPSLTSGRPRHRPLPRPGALHLLESRRVPPLWQPRVPALATRQPGVRAAALTDATMGDYFGNQLAGLEHKVSFLKGVGQLGAWGHQTSVALTGSERGEDISHRVTASAPDSLDNVLARSRAVYDSPPELDVLRLSMGGLGETHSYIDHRWVQAVEAEVAYAQLFESGFGTMDPMTSGPSEALLTAAPKAGCCRADADAIRRARCLRRLSAADRMRLGITMDQYTAMAESMRERIAALEGAPPLVGSACAPVELAGGDDSETKMRDHLASSRWVSPAAARGSGTGG